MAPEPAETRATRRRRERRRRRRLVAAVSAAVIAIVAAGAVVLATRGGDDPPTTVAAVGSTTSTAPPTTTPSTVPPTEPPTTTTTADPGSLPQTDDRPSATSPAFQERMSALWQAIVTDDPSVAMPAFFPLGAYLQVKDIANPESDYRNRLIAAYEEDIHALHRQLGAQAASAMLTSVDVPDDRAVWVQPGAEYNKGSYWRVYDTALRYATPDGRSGSIPIASLISWRGEWYVVHLSSIR